MVIIISGDTMKKYILTIIILISTLLLGGCTIANTPTAKTEELLSNYQRLDKNININYYDLSIDKNLTRQQQNEYIKLKCKFSMEDSNVAEYVEYIKCPVLYIHGSEDDEITPSNSYRLFEKTNSEKELYIVMGARHGESVFVEMDKYKRKIREFITVITGRETA